MTARAAGSPRLASGSARPTARLAVAGLALAGLSAAVADARADGADGDLVRGADTGSFTDLGFDLESPPDQHIDLGGYFRGRGDVLHNLDLNRGLTPSGEPLYPVPLGDPSSHTFHHADMRLRTDLTLYSPVGAAAVNIRADLLDNLGFGSMPDGPPQATVSQRPVSAVNIRRAYAEALTPVGLFTVGRMGNHWGLGMLAHGGDDLDSDSGDAADRVALITPMLGHIWAIAYDVAWSGPDTERRAGNRSLDLDPTDDVRAVTFAFMEYRSRDSLQRRLRAGRSTFDYGALVTHRWQDRDVPAHYLPGADDGDLGPENSMPRGLRATVADAWARLIAPGARVEAEAALLHSRIDQPSLVPGARLEESLEALQFGAAVETDFRPPGSPVGFGLDAGMASGDPAPGFGAFPDPYGSPAEPGDLDGPQSNPPYDNRIDNFRFHPDYRIDQILFRELIGTITDAAYIRPHGRLVLGEWGPGRLTAEAAAIASMSMRPTSPPGQSRPLGVEINPSLRYQSYNRFFLALDHGVLFPLSGLDNPDEGLRAQPAHALRLRVVMGF